MTPDTVTLKDAYLDYDPGTHSYNFQWRSPQSATSKLGRKVIVLAARRPLQSQMSGFGGKQAVFIAAVKLPQPDFDHIYSTQPPNLSSPDLNGLITGVSPSSFMPPDWGNVRLAGANSIAPAKADVKVQREFYDKQLSSLIHDQYQIIQMTVQVNLDPKQAKSIHLKTVTLTFYDQQVSVRHHVALNLPIETTIGPGWLPVSYCWVDGPAPPVGISKTAAGPPPGVSSAPPGGGAVVGGGFPGGYAMPAQPQSKARAVPGN